MRIGSLLPFTAWVLVIAGCGSPAGEQTTGSVPERDLTLVTPTSEVKIASPVEIQQLKSPRGTTYPSHRLNRPVKAPRSSHLEAPAKLADVWAPKLAPAPAPVAQPASTAAAPANDHELLPGQTVTLIPASSGPSTGSDRAEEPPADHGHTMVTHGGGGTCRGGGRGPGVARPPRPDFR